MFKAIFGAIGGLIGIGGKYMESKQAIKKAELDGKLAVTIAKSDAEVMLIKKNSESDTSLDMMSQKNMKNTFKDEYLMFLFTFPVLIACVSPLIICAVTGEWSDLLEITIESFAALDSLPSWLIYCILGIFIVTYGLRGLFRDLIKRKKDLINK